MTAAQQIILRIKKMQINIQNYNIPFLFFIMVFKSIFRRELSNNSKLILSLHIISLKWTMYCKREWQHQTAYSWSPPEAVIWSHTIQLATSGIKVQPIMISQKAKLKKRFFLDLFFMLYAVCILLATPLHSKNIPKIIIEVNSMYDFSNCTFLNSSQRLSHYY